MRLILLQQRVITILMNVSLRQISIHFDSKNQKNVEIYV